MDSRGRRPLYS